MRKWRGFKRRRKMDERIYIDTNIILDLFDETRPFYDESAFVIKKIFANPDCDAFINTDTLTNVFYILRSRLKLNLADSLENISFIKDSFTIVPIFLKDINFAIDICKNGAFNDYEDALQYACAVSYECSLFATNNKKDFKNATINVKTSKELALLWKK